MNTSVIIPTYNAAAFIGETLQSVFAQTLLPAEIIVVDDCSTDDTCEIVERLAKTSPARLTLIRLEKNSGGPATPLNTGIAAAKTEFIATLDHDDRMLPQRLKVQLHAMNLVPDAGLVFGRFQTRMPDQRILYHTEYDLLVDSMAKEYISDEVYRIQGAIGYEWLHVAKNYAISCSNLLFPKSVWTAVGGFDSAGRFACDFDILQKITARYDIVLVDIRVFEWDRRDDNLSVSAEPLAKSVEWIRLYNRYDSQRVAAGSRIHVTQVISSRIAMEMDGLAYCYRQAGSYFRALKCYLYAIRQYGVNGRTLSGIVKLIPHGVIYLATGQRLGTNTENQVFKPLDVSLSCSDVDRPIIR